MHILIIPSWYPTKHNKTRGIFFQEQAQSISKFFTTDAIGVISVVPISIIEFLKSKVYSFGYTRKKQYNFIECIYSFPAIPKAMVINKKIITYIGKILFRRYIKDFGMPDVIHLHSFALGELVLWIYEKYKIPFVYTEHSSAFYLGLLSDSDRYVVKKITENSYDNFAVSLKLAELISNQYKTKLSVLPNFIDTGFFKCENLSKYDKFTFINIAGLNLNKNHKLLISAYKKFYKNYPNTQLLIYGDGEEKQNLIDYIKKLDLSEAIVFGGDIGRDVVKKNLCKSHCFILTSKVETFGVVLIEAMSCGIPAISTKNGGANGIIKSENLGFLCEHTEESIFRAMEKTYQTYQTYDSKKIRKYVDQVFSEEAVVKRLYDIYIKCNKTRVG